MVKKVGVAILGLGVVGGGTYQTLVEHHDFYLKTQQVDISVEKVLDLNLERLKALGVPQECIAKNIEEVLADPNVDIVVETIGGIGVAKTFVTAALRAAKTVVTSNKELICKFSHELEKIAKHNHCGLYYEASCVGGVPIIRTLLDGVQANHIQSMMGIVNGTTNYILTKMTYEGADYAEVLKEAQKLGYAEANPTADVDGYDSMYKLSILSSMAFHTKIPYTKIFREGISTVNVKDIAYGREFGYTLKLLAIGKNSDKGIEVRVHPTFIPTNHPLASVNDSFNAVYMTGDAVDDVMLYGRGAGALPTASAVVSDVIYAATHSDIKYSTFKNNATAESNVKFVSDFASAYYIRLAVEDKAGVLAKVTGIFGKCGISIVQITQKNAESAEDERVPLVVITHKTTENAAKNAVSKINASGIGSVEAVIRVEQ
ncbi:MAG: homoserine dehydrogenase [Clostridiales bacterium]|nr:homoserine dehydrogenase [Clostridiales bacterium]